MDLFYQKYTPECKKKLEKLFIYDFENKIGRTDAHYTYVDQTSSQSCQQIINRLESKLNQKLLKKNPYLAAIVFGQYQYLLQIPCYTKDGFEHLKFLINKITIKTQPLEEYLNSNTSFDFYNLSDIFEYTSEKTALDLIQKIKGKAAWWNLYVDRSFGFNIKTKDRVFFYSNFCSFNFKKNVVTL